MIRTDFRSLIKGYQKMAFYVVNFTKYYMPKSVYRCYMKLRFSRLSDDQRREAQLRVDKYLRLPADCRLDDATATSIADFKYPFGKKKKFSAYFFDLYETICCFSPELRFSYVFGDIDFETPSPTFVKSRPITDEPTNSVVCRLNKVRHFRFISDSKKWEEKRNMVIMRSIVCKQPQRSRFLQMYLNHPMCDVGQINHNSEGHPEYEKPFVSMEDHLNFKFIMCIEGHDVATNLKWVMSSNSIAVMPRPKMESWFLESQLIGDYHYIEIADDYSNLIEKLNYYIEHPDKANEIIANAHRYVDKFRNATMEKYTQYQVVKQYFERLHQL